MTLKEVSDVVAGNLGREFDSALKERVKNIIITCRAILIRREFEKLGYVPSFALTEIGCIKVKYVDESECCSIKLPCNVLRTELQLPDLLALKERGAGFTSVTSNSRHKNFGYIDPAEIEYINLSRWGARPLYTYINKYIYLFNTDAKVIRVRAPFSNPLVLREFIGCAEEGSCFDEETSLFIEDHHIETIKAMVYEDLGKAARVNSPNTDSEIQINND